jgi:magnesium-transporting ATPase (P-type)
MVLTDDNFASIAHAVEEGRTVYDNIRKTMVFMCCQPVVAVKLVLVIAGDYVWGWRCQLHRCKFYGSIWSRR